MKRKRTENVYSVFRYYIIGFITISFTICGCQKRVSDNILETINKEMKSSEDCVVSIKSVTAFEWDTMFVFGELTQREEIEKAIGFSYNLNSGYVRDGYKKLMFTLNHEVVYEEDIKIEVNNYIEFNSVNDSLHLSKLYLYYSNAEAIFKVKKVKSNSCSDCFAYVLTPKL